MKIFQQEYDDGIDEIILSKASFSFASVLEPCNQIIKSSKQFRSIASVDDSDLYYTQSILVTSSWNKNDDIFDKNEVWAARHSPEHKPTNLEHDESVIIGHIVSNYPITEDGILIDENTPIENLPNKYHILTGSVIYKSYTQPELRERTEKLISEIENGTKYVSMECFFKGFDYGLIDKSSNEFKVLSRNNDTAYLTKYLKSYGGLGEYDNYKIGRVLRNITFSGKGYVDKPANPDSIIFSKEDFKFLNAKTKNNDFSKSGVNISQSLENTENKKMSEKAEEITVDCSEATKAAEAAQQTITQITKELSDAKASHEEVLDSIKSENTRLASELETLAKENMDEKEKMKKMEEEKKKMEASILELENRLNEANEAVAAYMKKEKKMMRKAALVEHGFSDEELESAIEKFDSVDDETFAAMTNMLKMKKDKEKMAKIKEEKTVITEAWENVEETEEIVPVVANQEEDDSVQNTRAALVDFVYNRLGKKLNKGE